MNNKLKELRKKIDKIDTAIVKLLNKRAMIAKEIGAFKKRKNEEIIDFSREKEVFAKILEISTNTIPEEDLKNIYREIIASSRKLQKSYTVAFLGPEASFSHLAFEKFFGKNTQYNLTKNIREIFIEVENKNSKFGIVPVENSLEGIVTETFDHLFEFNVKVWAELKLKISFNFVSFCNNSKNIKKIYSHPMALAQCRNFIIDNFGNIEIIPISSTSDSIKYIQHDKFSGAIVSPVASEVYNLPVLFKNIEANSNNYTRFFIISLDENKIKKGVKTSFIFAISHKPKSLFNALEVVAKYDLNMTKIESRPIKGIPWEYLFFVDIEGSGKEPFFDEFKKKTTFFKHLGTYPVETIKD